MSSSDIYKLIGSIGTYAFVAIILVLAMIRQTDKLTNAIIKLANKPKVDKPDPKEPKDDP